MSIIVQSGPAPTAAAGANNGTSPPAPVVATAAIDTRGNITFGSGSSPAAGAQVVVTINANEAAELQGTPSVILTPKNTATQALGLYVSAVSTTAFTVSTTNAPTASQANTVYSFDYVLIP